MFIAIACRSSFGVLRSTSLATLSSMDIYFICLGIVTGVAEARWRYGDRLATARRTDGEDLPGLARPLDAAGWASRIEGREGDWGRLVIEGLRAWDRVC